VKTWKVTNPGPADWPEGTKLIFVRGDRSLSSEEEFPVPQCEAGGTVDISALVVSPAINGRHTAVFRLADSERTPFGPRFWCDFVVGEPSSVPKAQEAQVSDVKSDMKFEVQVPSPSGPSTSAIPSEPRTEVQASSPSAPSIPVDPRKEKYAEQLQALSGMGFADEDLILNLLEVNDGNVQTVCDTLLNSMR